MGYWLASAASRHTTTWVKRFDPVYWTVDFPRPMMASLVTVGSHSLRVDAVFYRKNDLAGLIWASEDRIDHALLGYETSRDYQRCGLRFHWRSSGCKPLDAVNGPTLTIEGRDATGAAKSSFVRLWNYAQGGPEDAIVTLDFGALAEGFAIGGAPVFAGDVDRMFISLVANEFDNSDTPLPTPLEAWVEMSDIACDGSGSVLSLGDAFIRPHGLNISTGYDDSYNVTPARMLRNIAALGYRGTINHYVGMSHYLRLEPNGPGYYASLTGGALNVASAAWHRDFAARSKALGFGLIMSLSYELFDAHCWGDWKQRAHNGDAALTGYTPPSVLLSPAHAGAMAYLRAVARAFVQIAVDAGHRPRFQIGEPWWWVLPDGRICVYDAAAKSALGGNPVAIDDVRGAMNAAQKALLDAAGAVLATSTANLFAAVRGDHPECERLLLVFLPTVLETADLARANVPPGWAYPAFDVLQIEDYDWVTAGNTGASARGVATIDERLGYPIARQHYLSGFAREARDWGLILAADAVAQARGVVTRFLWALPQVLRDGLVYFDEGEAEVDAFDDVEFPLSLGKNASVAPEFSTAIVTTASGWEQRNADWASARMRFDAGPGVRSEADVATLIAFFRARRGAAKGFRFRDPFDFSSNGMMGMPGPTDQILGTGDGARTSFPLVKRYGAGPDAEVRRITRPVAVSVMVAIAGAANPTGWTLGAGGVVVFDNAPAPGAALTAGFRFDVPVRFAEDRIEVNAARWLAGDVGSVGLVEVRE